MNNLGTNYISLHEAAKLTSYSQDYISLLCRQKKLKGIKMGRNWVTTKEWVESYINRTNGSGESIIPVRVEGVPVGNRHTCSLRERAKLMAGTGLQPVSRVSQAGEKESEISKHTSSSYQEGNKERVTSSPQARAQESIPVFFRRTILVAFVVGIFSVGFVFFQNNILSSVNQVFGDSKKIMAFASFNANSFLSSFDKNQAGKETRVVAGASSDTMSAE